MADLVAAFEAQAQQVGAVVHRAPRDGVASLATRIVEQAGCRTVALSGALPERSSFVEAATEAKLELVSTQVLWPTRRSDGGLSAAELGVAESGSVLLHSSSEDRRVEMCVDVHLVLLAANRLVPTLEEAFTTLREISARPPAYATLVSGPSRSADIERTLTVGVHGPRELHILLIGAEP